MKNRKNKFSNRLRIFSMVVMFVMVAMGTFSYFAPETYSEIFGCLSLSGGTVTAGIFLPMNMIQRDPGGGGGSGDPKEVELIKKLREETQKEFKSLEKDFLEKNTEVLKIKALETKFQELEAKSKNLKEVEDFKTLAKEVTDVMAEVKALKEKGLEKKNLNFAEAVGQALEAKKAEIALLEKGGRLKLELKAADNITTSNFGAGVLRGLRLTEVDPLDRNAQTILPEITIIPGGPGSDPFSWVEKVIGEGNAAPTSESQNKPKYDWDYKENKVTAEVIAAIVGVSKQALKRMPQLSMHINEELMAELRETVQTQIITGNAAPPNLNGIQTNAVAFNPPASIIDSVSGANEYDVIAAVAGQVVLAHGMPTAIGVSPGMFTKLQTRKDANNQYLLPPFMQGMPTAQGQGAGLVIAGMRVIPMWDLGPDEFLGGDLRKYMFNIVEDITVEIGWINDMFQKNLLAVRAEMFGNGGVKDQHKNKIVKGTFTYAKAILDGSVNS